MRFTSSAERERELSVFQTSPQQAFIDLPVQGPYVGCSICSDRK